MSGTVAGPPTSVGRVVDSRRQVLSVLTALRQLLARQWLQQGDCFRKERRCQVWNTRFRLCVSCLRAFGVGERKCDVFNRPPNYPASAQCLAGCRGRWT